MHGPGDPVPSAARPATSRLVDPGRDKSPRVRQTIQADGTPDPWSRERAATGSDASMAGPGGCDKASRNGPCMERRAFRCSTVSRRSEGTPTRGASTVDQSTATHMPMAWRPLLGCQGRCVTGLRDTLSLVTAWPVTKPLSQQFLALSQPQIDPCHRRCHSTQGQAVTARGTGTCLRGPSRVAPCVPTLHERWRDGVGWWSTEALSWRS